MKNLTYEQLLGLANAAAIKIAKENDDDELLIVADFFALIGSALTLIHDRKGMDSPPSNADEKS